MIDKNEFLRSFEVRPDASLGVFLGSGASVSAGIPTAAMLVWEFKRKLYCDHFQIKEEKFKDIESESNKNILQIYFDAQQDFPSLNSKEEYYFYFEKCFPNSIDRKFFIQHKVGNINPTIGHKCLGELINVGKIDRVFTANFDELIENGIKAVNVSKSVVIISPDNANNLPELSNSGYPKVIKLHGDYRYDKLQNTSQETQDLDIKLREHLLEISKQKGLIVIGYCGNDNSIISVLREVLSKGTPFPYGLIWCVRNGEVPNKDVEEIVEEANRKNKLSGFLEIASFDEFLYEIYSRCNLKNPEIEKIAETLFQQRRPFISAQANQGIAPIKLNGLPIESYPKSAYSFNATITGWQELRSLISGKNIISALHGGKVFAFGEPDTIKQAFTGKLSSDITITDIEPKWISNQDSFYMGMLYELIAHSLINKFSLKTINMFSHKGKYYSDNRKIACNGLPGYLQIHNAFEIQLSHFKDLFWFILLPTVEVVDTRNQATLTQEEITKTRFIKQVAINNILSKRWNAHFSKELDDWLAFLRQGKDYISFSFGSFEVKIDARFAYGGYKRTDKNIFMQGLFLVPEPKLLFHSSETNYNNIHPLKGLHSFGPYDFSLQNQQANRVAIKIAVISPKDGFSRLITHLNGLSNVYKPTTEKDYLIDYPGFSAIYKKYLEVPNNIDNRFCVLIDESEVINKKEIEFYDIMKRKIDYFDTIKGEFDILIIYFPTKWQKFRELKNQTTYFDLHDSVKIYCAKKNIKVQFIEDKSIDYEDQAKVKWWLSLAIYAKANGIPWKNEIGNENTAFIGLGYALKPNNSPNKVVIGCSQLFDSSGQGLRFLLHPIENPVFHGENPFMNREDARRLILRIKEAYFRMDPNARLEKIVIHKTNYFTREEIEGIAQALDGVSKVELLQIQQFSRWRAIRLFQSKFDKHFKPNGYPILRGTTLQLDDFSFLLWTHGAVMSDSLAGSGRNYYQGARGIPSPLLIRRFRGQDPIELTSQEILRLTKMNWNGGQLYKTLPVTLDFSKALSEIAKQTESLLNTSYDFRFFM